jgi:hypothetical protein
MIHKQIGKHVLLFMQFSGDAIIILLSLLRNLHIEWHTIENMSFLTNCFEHIPSTRIELCLFCFLYNKLSEYSIRKVLVFLFNSIISLCHYLKLGRCIWTVGLLMKRYLASSWNLNKDTCRIELVQSNRNSTYIIWLNETI